MPNDIFGEARIDDSDGVLPLPKISGNMYAPGPTLVALCILFFMSS